MKLNDEAFNSSLYIIKYVKIFVSFCVNSLVQEKNIFLQRVWHKIFDFRFFHESVSPGPFYENLRR